MAKVNKKAQQQRERAKAEKAARKAKREAKILSGYSPKKARQKSTIEKQRQTLLLQREGYTEKEVKRLPQEVKQKEVQRVNRNWKERQRLSQNRAALLKEKIPLSIITAERLDRKGIKNLSKKQISDYKRRGEKLDALKEKGVPYTKAKSDLNLSWEKLAAKYDIEYQKPFSSKKIYSGDTYLYVGFAQKIDGFRLENLSGWTDEELIERIQERYQEAKNSPDDSGSFAGAFTVFVGSKSDAEAIASDYFERGYKFSARHRVFKTDTASYSKVTLKSDFSQRKFHEMIYTCISQMRNDQVPEFMQKMSEFCSENGTPFFNNLNLH